MALLPELHFTLDRPTIQHLYQIFMPIVPGGALVVGLLLLHPDYFAHVAATSGVGYFSRITTTVFIGYVVGLILYGLSVHFGLILSISLGPIFYSVLKLRPFRNNTVISENRVWRSVATAFLGDELAPQLLATPNPDVFQRYSADWNDWYNLLQDYVLRGTHVLAPEVLFLFTIIQATGWAIIVLAVHSGYVRHHQLAIIVIGLLVFLTAAAPFAANYFYQSYDRLTATDLTARLLAEIRSRDLAALAKTQDPK